ncbi:hypothetical protein ACWDBF_04575 [Streptomyces angustmyceticus]
MTERTGREPSYAELMAELSAFRTDHMQGRPSDRALAQAVGVSPTTIGKWLRADQFPQQIDLLLALVRGVRGQAEDSGLTDDPGAARLLDLQQWRSVYRDEARRRADGTSAAVQAEQGRAALQRMRPGRPLAEVTDPFALEVHRAVDVPAKALPVLPEYVPREHDRRLAEVVSRAAAGASQVAVLVGGSSTGKTRACWEALTLLRGQGKPWRLWHPIDPTRPDAALAELADIGPYTVIWLNEAQFYLEPDVLGERVAAGLRTLLRDPRRGPVLVLATLWPESWDTLTGRAAPDAHAQARELLQGHKIAVPDAFVGTELDALTDMVNRDPRLDEAFERAQDGQIAQYLAGVPVLMDRYQEARGATKALIHAAMDARRLGAGPRIPLALLADAALGYLTEREWGHTGDDWLQLALDFVTTHCNGIPGILTPVNTGTPPQPAHPPRCRSSPPGRAGAAVPAGRLPRPARPQAPRRPDPPNRLLDCRRCTRPPRRPPGVRRRRLEPRPLPRRRPTPQTRRHPRQSPHGSHLHQPPPHSAPRRPPPRPSRHPRRRRRRGWCRLAAGQSAGGWGGGAGHCVVGP